MKYSVILPVYNVEMYLKRCLDSLLNQNYHNFEIILVNDGSEDNSLEICKRYSDNYPNIKVINQKNSGTGVARNKGLEVALGEYIFFCDPDDYISGEFFLDAEKYLETSPDVVFFNYFDEIETNRNKSIIKKMSFQKELKIDSEGFKKEFIELFKTNMLYTLWNKLYNRKFLINNNLRFTTAAMGQDTRFNLRVYNCVSTIQIVKQSYYHYIKYRKDSSTSKYRENRTFLKLEEVGEIQKLIDSFALDGNDFINDLAVDAFIDGANHILLSNLSIKLKKEKLIALINLLNKEYNYLTSDKVQFRLLQKKKVNEYFVLKKIQKSLRAIKNF